MVRVHGVDEAKRLLTVHGLGKGAMQECILDVQLVDEPTATNNDGEYCSNGGWLDDRAECLIVVEALGCCEKPRRTYNALY